MTTFNQQSILLAVILVVIRTTYANFDYCIGVNSVSPAREVVGFQLWNDRGEEAAQYRSLSWAHKTIMQNNDWFLYIDFTPLPINPESISVFSSVYGEIGPVPFELACGIGNFNGSNLFYGCFENNGTDYCRNSRPPHLKWCRTNLNMGTDGFSC